MHTPGTTGPQPTARPKDLIPTSFGVMTPGRFCSTPQTPKTTSFQVEPHRDRTQKIPRDFYIDGTNFEPQKQAKSRTLKMSELALEEGTRAAGRNDPPRHRARRLAHVPLLPRAMYGRRAMAHARAAAAAPATGGFRRLHRPWRATARSDRPQTTNSRGFRRETPSIRLCPCVDKTTHAQAEGHRRPQTPLRGTGGEKPTKG